MTDPAATVTEDGVHATLAEPFGLRWRYALAAVLFFVVYRVLGLRRGVIRGNLERSFPHLDSAGRARVAREFVQRQSQVFAEIDYARRFTADELRARVQLIDPHGVLRPHAAAAFETEPQVTGLYAVERRVTELQRPRLVVFVGGHQCNFEWLLLRLSLELGAGMIGLYKPLRGAAAERYFKSIRTRFGAQLLPAKSVTRELGTIRQARALGLIADQVPRTSPERHWTTFLHQRTAFFKGAERLARALRAPLVYVSMRRHARGQYEIELEPLTVAGEKLPNGTATERYAQVLERDIVADPPGWWWSHKRWKKVKDDDAGVA